MSVDIGGRLRFVRSRHKLSQRELAKPQREVARAQHQGDGGDE